MNECRKISQHQKTALLDETKNTLQKNLLKIKNGTKSNI